MLCFFCLCEGIPEANYLICHSREGGNPEESKLDCHVTKLPRNDKIRLDTSYFF